MRTRETRENENYNSLLWCEFMINIAVFESISNGAGRVDHALFESNYSS